MARIRKDEVFVFDANNYIIACETDQPFTLKGGEEWTMTAEGIQRQEKFQLYMRRKTAKFERYYLRSAKGQKITIEGHEVSKVLKGFSFGHINGDWVDVEVGIV